MQPTGKNKDRWMIWPSAAIGLALLAGWGYMVKDRALHGINDFMQLYAGATLIGSPGLYDIAANQRVAVQATGIALEGVNYTRPPFYAVLLRPLAHLPYRVAYAVFEIVSLAALLVFIGWFYREIPELVLFVGLSLPAIGDLLNGQDISLVVLCLGGALLLMRKDRDFAAGVLLSLCSIKFHLLLLLPLSLAVRGKWRVLGGGAAGGAALAAISFLAAGWRWPLAYAALLSNPVTNPGAEIAPNLRPLLMAAGGANLTGILISGIVVAGAVVFLSAKARTPELAIAVSLVGSLLISYHATISDALLLLPVFVVVMSNSDDKALRAAAALILTPPLYLCLLGGMPSSLAVPVAEVVLLGLFVREVGVAAESRALHGMAEQTSS
jgi:alpha-1,2-mannosyltransferase